MRVRRLSPSAQAAAGQTTAVAFGERTTAGAAGAVLKPMPIATMRSACSVASANQGPAWRNASSRLQGSRRVLV